MEELRLALLGFGSANRALARMLLEKSEQNSSGRPCLRISETKLMPWKVVCVLTRRHGRVCVTLSSSDGQEVDIEAALQRIDSGEMLLDDSLIKGVNNSPNNNAPAAIIGNAPSETLQLLTQLGETRTANILVEAIPSNPKGDGEPVISFLTAALNAKLHVVSANKTPLAHCHPDGEEVYWELQKTAMEKGVMYKHESAVMDGIPVFSLWNSTLPLAKLTSIRGLLNSTTTLILTRMEGNLEDEGKGGESFEEGLKAAQEVGIVEEDDSLDLDGYDAAVKLRALLVVFSSQNKTIRIPTMAEIPRDSIRTVTREDIRRAYVNGKQKYRVVASAQLIDLPSSNNNGPATKAWEASVQLQLLAPSDPLYNLTGTDASVTFCTDVMGPVTVVSSEPTLKDTAYGLFADIIRVANES